MRTFIAIATLALAAQALGGLIPVWNRKLTSGQIEASGGYLIVYEPDGVLVLTMDKGKDVLRIKGHVRVTIQGDIALATRSSVPWDDPGAIEAWSLATKKLLWSIPTANFPWLGNLSQGRLIYTDKAGLHETEVPSGKKLRSRAFELPSYIGPRSVHVTPSRIYVSLGHEIFGLDPNDFARGWRCYVDVKVDALDGHGVYGFGTLVHDVAAVDESGKIRWRLMVRKGTFDNASTKPALKDGVLAVGGARVTRSLRYVSGYLFALDALTGTHLWKKPMDALAVQSFAGGFAVVASHRRGSKTVQALEVYEPKTGRLLGRRPVAMTGWYPSMTAQGSLLGLVDERGLTVYRWTRGHRR